jgi:hypothetical protein
LRFLSVDPVFLTILAPSLSCRQYSYQRRPLALKLSNSEEDFQRAVKALCRADTIYFISTCGGRRRIVLLSTRSLA